MHEKASRKAFGILLKVYLIRSLLYYFLSNTIDNFPYLKFYGLSKIPSVAYFQFCVRNLYECSSRLRQGGLVNLQRELRQPLPDAPFCQERRGRAHRAGQQRR